MSDLIFKPAHQLAQMINLGEVSSVEVLQAHLNQIYLEGEGYEKTKEIELQIKQAGRFILATNLVDDDKLKPEEIITNYKNQQSCERGFRFMKDPLFFCR